MILRERERDQFVVPIIYAFISWFLYVPWLGIELWLIGKDTLTNWATWPGPALQSFKEDYKNINYPTFLIIFSREVFPNNLIHDFWKCKYTYKWGNTTTWVLSVWPSSQAQRSKGFAVSPVLEGTFFILWWYLNTKLKLSS